MIELSHVTKTFGGATRALDDLTLTVPQGAVYGLVGSNGAGKTTAFNVITGVYQPTNGAVWFDGAKIIENHPQGKMKKQYKGQCDGLYTETLSPTPDKITRAGMARTFQNIRLFKKMTVIENVKTAMQGHTTYGMADAIFRTKKYWQQEAEITARAKELLSVVPVLLPGLPAMAGLALSIGAGCCAWGSALVLLGDADTRMLAHKLRTKLQGDSRS